MTTASTREPHRHPQCLLRRPQHRFDSGPRLSGRSREVALAFRQHLRATVLDARMAQSQPPSSTEPTAAESSLAESSPELDQARRTSMAAERTWLAWWRTALAASVGALGVGRLAPELLQAATWPYILLGCGYASLAIGLLLAGAQRQRQLERALQTGEHIPLRFGLVGTFTVGGVALAILTVVLIIAQT